MAKRSSEDEKMVRRYTFKLYPNKGQEQALERQCVLLARLWNAALEQREIQWSQQCLRNAKGDRKGLSQFDQQRELKTIRADDPEYEAMSSASLELTIKALDMAFQAFFRRAKSGAGASSGYPQYKAAKRDGQDWRHYHHATIWHRDGKGWKLERAGKQWKIYAKGIPGKIKARGKFPADNVELRDMQIIRRDNAWWMSVVVRMDARRCGGETPIEVDFDLIDEFASVKNRSNGECLSGLSIENFLMDGRKSKINHGHNPSSGDEPHDLQGDDRNRCVSAGTAGGDEPHDLQGDDRTVWPRARSGDGDEPHDLQDIDSIQSEGDRRYKRGSYRWRKQKNRIARMKAHQARKRRDDMHRWTTHVIRSASDVLVIKPDIKDGTKSAKGTIQNPGAAVKTVALLNRRILEQAPAAAIAMLEYKAKEAGVEITVLEASEHKISIGRDLSAATKLHRGARRKLKKETANEHV